MLRGSLVPRPNLLEKEGPGIHCLRMHVIKPRNEEGHMMFPIHMLDDVMYCTRTKPGLELYFRDSLSTLQSLHVQSMTNGVVS